MTNKANEKTVVVLPRVCLPHGGNFPTAHRSMMFDSESEAHVIWGWLASNGIEAQQISMRNFQRRLDRDSKRDPVPEFDLKRAMAELVEADKLYAELTKGMV